MFKYYGESLADSLMKVVKKEREQLYQEIYASYRETPIKGYCIDNDRFLNRIRQLEEFSALLPLIDNLNPLILGYLNLGNTFIPVFQSEDFGYIMEFDEI